MNLPWNTGHYRHAVAGVAWMEIPLRRLDSNPGHDKMATAFKVILLYSYLTRALRMLEQCKTEESLMYEAESKVASLSPAAAEDFSGHFSSLNSCHNVFHHVPILFLVEN